MQVQLTFRGTDPTFEIEHRIFKEAKKLDRICRQQLSWCHVVIDQPHRRRRGGRPYRIQVTLLRTLGHHVTSTERSAVAVNKNPYLAISNVFQAVRSQLRSRAPVRTNDPGGKSWFVGQEGTTWH